MYDYFKGIVTYVCPYYIVIEVADVGYQLNVANPYFFSPSDKKKITLFVHQVIREDSNALYGFSTLEEKQLFLQLLKVSGIGPKSALAILASNDSEGFIQAIESENLTYLTKFPGVGKKTAQQIVLDLKGKIEVVSNESTSDKGISNRNPSSNVALDEALEALLALGYKEKEIQRIEKQLANSDIQSTDVFIREGLKLLTKTTKR